MERTGWQFRRRRIQLLSLLEHGEPAEGASNLSASVHLLHQIAILVRFLFRCLNDRLGPFDGRPADAKVASDVVAGVARVGPLTFRHCSGMTEVRPGALSLPRLAALQRLDGPLQRNDLARQEIFADEVLVGLTSSGLEQVHNRHRYLGPAKLPASFHAALTSDQSA